MKLAKNKYQDKNNRTYFALKTIKEKYEFSSFLMENNLTISEIEQAFISDWEVEKPKKWYRVFITMAGHAIVAEDKDEMSTPREAHINSGNDFKTHEDAQIVADKINSILRGEE